MKFVHLSDLHLGKRIHEVSLLADQEYIMQEILRLIKESGAEAVLIAGDVYDKTMPSGEAVQLFDRFLSALHRAGRQVFIIAGNHDSAERLSFGREMMAGEGVHIAPVFDGVLRPHTLRDAWGEMDVYMLPFVKAAAVRRFYPEEEIADTHEAVAAVLRHTPLDKGRRNILLAHQFITGAARSQSEEVSVGGTDDVAAALFADFDYVALGHLHVPQSVGRETLRYCGSPLAYSFSEAAVAKTLTVVEMEKKGNVHVETLPLQPLRAMRELRGGWDEITLRENYIHGNTEDYLRVILTDEEDVFEALGRLRIIYPNILSLAYDNLRTRQNQTVTAVENEQKTPLELFAELYERQNNQPMSAEQLAFVRGKIKEIWEEEA